MGNEQTAERLYNLIQPDGWRYSKTSEMESPPKQVLSLGSTNFNTVLLENNGPLLVLFLTAGCPGCDSVRQEFWQSAVEARGLAQFGVVDASATENKPLVDRFRVTFYP